MTYYILSVSHMDLGWSMALTCVGEATHTWEKFDHRCQGSECYAQGDVYLLQSSFSAVCEDTNLWSNRPTNARAVSVML